ncbi:hypothetical protein [Mycoplasma sp. Ms02]|uniref:hypothetical protein n=1 Tax=Mycoplasma sp. Ms02 TaxID=353851 RepID=UPI001C89121B|nr:hypothetical protein [Mycoplasma sp. Ms02]QZE12676.1 hypothetical protein K4L35_01685 [Mycoplasma sp. Ms02]
MSTKGNKTKIALGVSATLLAIGGLSTTAILLTLNNKYQEQNPEGYVFEQLKNESQELLDFLSSEAAKNLSEENRKALNQLLENANQLLSNEKTGIADLVIKRNELRNEKAKAKVKIAESQDLNSVLDAYVNQVKDSDLKKLAQEALENAKSQLANSADKSEVLNNLFASVDNLIKSQNELQLALETKVWTMHKELANGTSVFTKPAEKALVANAIQQVVEMLERDEYTNDNIIEYSKMFSKVVNDLSENTTKVFDAKMEALRSLDNVRDIVQDAALEADQKQEMLDRLEEYKKSINNPVSTLAPTKAQELEVLKTLIKQEIENIQRAQKTDQENKNDLLALIETAKNLQANEKVQELVKQKSGEVESKLDQLDKNAVLKAQREISEILTLSKTISDLVDQINQNQESYKQEKSITEELANKTQESLTQVFAQENLDLESLLKQVSDIFNSLNDAAVINQTLKAALKEVKEQAQHAKETGYQVDTNALESLIDQLSNGIDNPQDTNALNDMLVSLSNQLRDINKKELTDLFEKSKELLDTATSLSQNTKDRLNALNSQAQTMLAKTNSPFRAELQNLIEEYKKTLDAASADIQLADFKAKANKVKEAISEKFEEGSTFNDKLQKQIDKIVKQAELIALDKTLDEETRAQKLQELEDQMNKVLENTDKFKKLEDSIKNAQDELAKVTDPAEAAALKKQIDKINDLIDEGIKSLDNPQDTQADRIAQDIDQAVNDFINDKNNYRGDAEYLDAVAKINKGFGGDLPENLRSPAHQNFLDKAQQLRDKIKDPSLSEEEHQKAIEDLQKLAENAEKAKELENAAKKLEDLIKQAEARDFGQANNPTAEITKAKEELAKIKDALANLNNSDITPAEDYEAKIADATKAQEDLSDALDRAGLKQAMQNLELSLYDDPEGDKENQTPYVDSNNSVKALVAKMQELLDKQDPKATKEELIEAQKRVQQAKILADKLKEANEKLATVNAENHPEAYNNLKQAILDNLMNIDDTRSQEAQKVQNLDIELSKTDRRAALADKLKELKTLYSDEDKAKAIHKEDAAKLEEIIAEYQKELENPETTASRLQTILAQAEAKKKEFEAKKALREEEFKKAVDDTQAQIDALKELAKATGVTDLTNLDKVVAEFETAKADTTNSTPQTIADIKKKLELAYQKDLFNKKYEDLKAKIDGLTAYSDTEDGQARNVTDEVKKKLNALNDAIKAGVDTKENPEDALAVKRAIEKLASLDNLTDREGTYLDSLNDRSNNQEQTAVDQRNKIADALISKIPTSVDNLGEDVTNPEIRKATKDIFDVYLENSELDDIKTAEEKEIDKFKKAVEDSFKTTDEQGAPTQEKDSSKDPVLEDALLKKIEELRTELKNAENKEAIPAIDEKLQDLKNKKDKLVELSQTVKKAADKVAEILGTDEAPINDVDPAKKAIADKIKEITNQIQGDGEGNYLSLSEEDILAKKNKIEELLKNLNTTTEIKEKVKELNTLLDGITYPEPDWTLEEKPRATTPENAEAAKTAFKAYVQKLNDSIDANATDVEKLEEIKLSIDPIKNAIEAHKAAIEKYNQIKADEDYKDVSINPDSTSKETYGFAYDADKFANAIIATVPVVGDSTTESITFVEKKLLIDLNKNTEAAFDLYESRKSTLDRLIFNRKDELPEHAEPKNNSYKFSQKARLVNEQGNVEDKYAKLWARNNEFYNEQAQKVKASDDNNKETRAQQLEKFSDALNQASLVTDVFDYYVEIADKISLAKEAIKKAEDFMATSGTREENTSSLRDVIAQLKSEIEWAEGSEDNSTSSAYYSEKNPFILQTKRDSIKNKTALLDLGIAVAKALDEIDKYNTNKPNSIQNFANFLEDSDKQPLREIIKLAVSESLNSAGGEEVYQEIKEKYIDGFGDFSYKTALQSSLGLRKAVFYAQEYVKFNAQTTENFSKSNEVAQKYQDLQNKITSSEALLSASNVGQENASGQKRNNDTIKEAAESILNPTDGVLTEIRRLKSDEVRHQLNNAKRLQRLIDSYYNGAAVPGDADFETVAIQDLERAAWNYPNEINLTNEKLKKSIDKTNSKYQAIFDQEITLLTQAKDRYKEYYDLLSNSITENGVTVDAEKVLKTSGINASDLREFETIQQTSEADLRNKFNEAETEESNPKRDTLTLITSQKEKLNRLEERVKVVSVNKLKADTKDYEKFKNVLSDEQNGWLAFLKRIKYYGSTNAISTNMGPRINDFVSKWAQVPLITDVSNFQQYSDLLKKVTVLDNSYDKMFYGESETDIYGLKTALNRFLLGDDSYVGFSNLEEFLKTMTTAEFDANSPKFQKAYAEFNKTAEISKAINQELQSLDRNTTSKAQMFITSSKLVDSLDSFSRWFESPVNTKLIYDALYLNGLQPIADTDLVTKPNYAAIEPKDSTTAEKFHSVLQKIKKLDIRGIDKSYVNGTEKQAVNISNVASMQEYADLFNKFNILKNDSEDVLNLYKNDFDRRNPGAINKVSIISKGTNSDGTHNFITIIDQAETSFKRALVDLNFSFRNSRSRTSHYDTWAFAHVSNINHLIENVSIVFKTRESVSVGKSNLSDLNKIGKEPLFTSEEAGWTPSQTSAYLTSAFASATLMQLNAQNATYFTENVVSSENGSNSKFKIKIKMSKSISDIDGNTYTQDGDEIYWKPLNPQYMSGTEIAYQENVSSYDHADVRNSSSQTDLTWREENYDGYRTTLSEKDQNKILSMLPIVVSVPATVTSSSGSRKGAIVFRIVILNRFEANPTGPQTVVLNADVLDASGSATLEHPFGSNTYLFLGDSNKTDSKALAKETLDKIKYPQYIRKIYAGLSWSPADGKDAKSIYPQTAGATYKPALIRIPDPARPGSYLVETTSGANDYGLFTPAFVQEYIEKFELDFNLQGDKKQ